MDRRLRKRYVMLVESHMKASHSLAAGIASTPDVTGAFAATQAAWRFLNNDRITLSCLAEPLRNVGRQRTESLRSPFVMLVHDWCKLSFSSGREDMVQLTHENDIGYELTTALLVSPDDGSPLAPLEMHLKTRKKMLSTRDPTPRRTSHLEQVLPTMKASSKWGLSRPILHVMDREADSVDHYRRWDAGKHRFLVRADDRRVEWNDQSVLLSEITVKQGQRGAFRHVGKGVCRGRRAELHVAETAIVLYRPAKKNVGGRKFERPGRRLALRFIVVQLRDSRGKMLAEWKLLSNAPTDWADAHHLALRSCWRWRVESFFKLLKSHGHQLEHWRQRSGPALAWRMLIAAMACVVVWQLQADESSASEELKAILIRLSGRQMKRSRPHTAPALLAGLWTLLSMLALLDQI